MAALGDTTAPVFRWMARFCAIALLAMVVAFYAKTGPSTPFHGFPTEKMSLVAFLLVTLGLAVGWLWDGAGALLILGGMIVFTALEYSANRALPGGAFAWFWIPGFLWLLSAIMTEKKR